MKFIKGFCAQGSRNNSPHTQAYKTLVVTEAVCPVWMGLITAGHCLEVEGCGIKMRETHGKKQKETTHIFKDWQGDCFLMRWRSELTTLKSESDFLLELQTEAASLAAANVAL